MMTKPPEKTWQTLDLLNKHPDWPFQKIADAVGGISWAFVRNIYHKNEANLPERAVPRGRQKLEGTIERGKMARAANSVPPEKTSQILDLLNKHLDWSFQKIAKTVGGISWGSVRSIYLKNRGKLPKRTTRKRPKGEEDGESTEKRERIARAIQKCMKKGNYFGATLLCYKLGATSYVPHIIEVAKRKGETGQLLRISGWIIKKGISETPATHGLIKTMGANIVNNQPKLRWQPNRRPRR